MASCSAPFTFLFFDEEDEAVGDPKGSCCVKRYAVE
jgi:hypothetical protein